MFLTRGFSALPILIIISILSGGALLILAGNTYDARQSNLDIERANEAEINSAINGFTLAFGRLPCPDTDSDGVENCSDTQTSGYLPYVTLGIVDQRAGRLAFAANQKSVAKGLSSTSNSKQITVPSELPAGVITKVIVPDTPAPPGDPVNENIERAIALYLLEGFYAGLFTDTAIMLNGLDYSNEINRSYISAFASYLPPASGVIDVEIVSGKNLDYISGSGNYQDIQNFSNDLQKFVAARALKEKIDNDPRIIEVPNGDPSGYDFPGRISALQADISRINAGGAVPTGACGSLDCVLTRWNSFKVEYNTIVNNYNAARLSGVPALVVNSFNEANLNSTDDADRTASLFSALSSLQDSLNTSSKAVSDTIQSAATNTISGDPSQLDILITRFDVFVILAEDRINFYKARLVILNDADPKDQNAIDADESSLDDFKRAKVLYEDLSLLLNDLKDDLSSSAVQDFIDLLNDGLPDNTNPPTLDKVATCDEISAKYDSPPFYTPDCETAFDNNTIPEYIDGLGTPPTIPPVPEPTERVNYSELVNLADFCDKLGAIPGEAAQSLNSGGLPVAYLLIQPGDNRTIDTPNMNNSGNFNAARPDKLHSLTYDDGVLVVSPDELENRLACSSLINAYRSYDIAIKEIELLYENSVSVLGDAEQDRVIAIISLALVTAQLAVDIGAIVQETIGGVAATVACVASLGLAVNACVAAGLEFAAAAVHGITVVTDGVNVAQAAIALADAISSVNDAQVAKNNVQSHFADVVNTAIKADTFGGVQEFN